MINPVKFSSILLFVSTLFSSHAWAGSIAALKQIGFSADGQYFAFTTYSSDDMSSVECTKTTFIEVLTNKWVQKPYQVCKDPDQELGSAEKLAKDNRFSQTRINNITKELGIDFSDTGTTVLSRKPYRYWGGQDNAPEFAKTDDKENFRLQGLPSRYQLHLSKQAVKLAECAHADTSASLMQLKLIDLSKRSEQVLQADKTLPKSRNCAMHYRLQNAYVHNVGDDKGLVVMIQYYTPGVEGPDELYMAVSGKVNF